MPQRWGPPAVMLGTGVLVAACCRVGADTRPLPPRSLPAASMGIPPPLASATMGHRRTPISGSSSRSSGLAAEAGPPSASTYPPGAQHAFSVARAQAPGPGAPQHRSWPFADERAPCGCRPAADEAQPLQCTTPVEYPLHTSYYRSTAWLSGYRYGMEGPGAKSQMPINPTTVLTINAGDGAPSRAIATWECRRVPWAQVQRTCGCAHRKPTHTPCLSPPPAIRRLHWRDTDAAPWGWCQQLPRHSFGRIVLCVVPSRNNRWRHVDRVWQQRAVGHLDQQLCANK